jgi:cell fate (sporulation/competence/biofilm development) regulator YmcA (YheA/YmcA/DUF963 family)
MIFPTEDDLQRYPLLARYSHSSDEFAALVQLIDWRLEELMRRKGGGEE